MKFKFCNLFLLKLIKNFIYQFILIIVIKALNSKEEETINYDIKYPISFTLLNQNIMIYSTKGIFTFNSDLSLLIYSYNFTSELKLDEHSISDIYYPSFSQFSEKEGANILCFVLGNVYLFDKNGKFLYNSNKINDIIYNKDITFRIISYKYENKDIFYTIIYTYKKKVYTLLYKINEENGENEKLINTFYDNEERDISKSCLTCQRMKKINEYYIVCFYSYYKSTKAILAEETFEPKNNFSFLSRIELEETNLFHSFESVVNEDESKAYICYTSGSYTSCLYYDINLNEFSQSIKTARICKGDMFSFRLYYFKETEEYIFSCKNFINNITIAKFDQNMEFIKEPIEFTIEGFYSLNSFSILYFKGKEKYKVLLYIENKNPLLLSFPESISSPNKTKIPEGYYLSGEELKECHYNCKTCKKGPVDDSENCLTCKNNQKFINNKGNCICDYTKEFYSIQYINGTIDDKCYSNMTKPINFYLNKETNLFEMCHQNCRTCETRGNEKENNCTTCISNYIKKPDSNYSKSYINCVPKCPFYYYITPFQQYLCTEDKQCPEEAKLLIKIKKECINNCLNDDKYKYQYNGQCFETCPIDTYFNGDICKETNSDECSPSIIEINIPYENITYNKIELLTKNYIDEFYYSNNKIVKYINDEYSIFIYKNNSCGDKLKMPKIDFNECYKKVQLAKNIKDNLLIVIIERYYGKENPVTSYGFYDPKTGKKINVDDILKDETIIIRENILSFPGINSSLIKFFGEQGINVLDINDKFFIDVCLDYISPNKRDIPLKLRIKIFFPNISLCDDGCVWKSFDFEKMESVCECVFNDLIHNNFINNTLKFVNSLNNIYEMISESNIDVLICINNIIIFKNFIKNYGSFFYLFLMLIHIIFHIIYCLFGIKKIKKYIYSITTQYINSNYLKTNKKIEKILISHKSTFIKKKKVKKKKKINFSSSIYNISSDKLDKTIIKLEKDNKLNNINISKKTNFNEIIKYNNSNMKEINFEEYLSIEYDDMDFDDILEKDKRTFLNYLLNTIKEKNFFINSFFINDNIKPKSIKIIIFVLSINFYFILNALYYTESYIIGLYYISLDEPFFGFVGRTFNRIIFTTFISFIINELIDCFVTEEKKIKGIFLRGLKKNELEIKNEIFLLIKKIKRKYCALIVLSYIIISCSWIYISCFVDVYYNTGFEWAKSGCFYFILMHIFSIINRFLETSFRFMAIYCKSEKMFKFSKLIGY